MKDDKIIMLLQRKKDLFSVYLDDTKCLLEADSDDADRYINNREAIGEKINTVQEQLISEIALSHNPQELESAIHNSCSRADLSGERMPIFDISQQIFSLINQINRLNDDIILKWQKNKDDLLDNIKSINNKQEAKASKFLNTTIDGSKPHIPEKIKRI